jgi:plastocyanin
MRSSKLLAAGATLVAVGASTGVYSPAAAKAPVRHRITVKEREFKLIPKTLRATHGRITITVRNTGSVSHALEVEGGGRRGRDVETHHVRPGRSVKLKLTLTRGHYEIYCPIDHHKQLGMKGTLVVH